MSVLICSLGTNWTIAVESIGFVNWEIFDLYKNHPQKVQIDLLRKQYITENVNVVYIIGTDSKKSRDEFRKIKVWCENTKIIEKSGKIYFFCCKEIDDIKCIEDVERFRELAYRVIVESRLGLDKNQYNQNKENEIKENKMYISVAGGRKTMSTDLQNGAFFFGCDCLFHIIDTGIPEEFKNIQPNQLLKPPERDVIKNFMPVVIGKYDRNDAINFNEIKKDLEKLSKDGDDKVKNYNSSDETNIDKNNGFNKDDDIFYVKDDKKIVMEYVNKVLERAANYYKNFDTTEDTFKILYQYKDKIIQKLKNTHIGTNIKNRERDLKLLKGLPKVDLHCHLGGSLTFDNLIELRNTIISGEVKGYDEYNFTDNYFERIIESNFSYLQNDSKKELLKKLFKVKDANELKKEIFGKYCNEIDFRNIGINEYEKLGDIQGTTLLQKEEIIRFTIRKLLEKAYENNVIHLEIRCSPMNYTMSGLTGKNVLEIICDEIEKYIQSDNNVYFCGEGNQIEKFKMSIGILIIASRHKKMSDIYRHIELIEDMQDDKLFQKYFKGIDLAGDESRGDPEKIRSAFLTIMEKCPYITIHAGETKDADSIWKAIYHLNAERIGHGLTLENDEKLMNKILDRNIGVEMCPSSNFQIGNFKDNYFTELEKVNGIYSNKKQKYPLKKYLDKGICVSINTDNIGISLTDQTNEILKAGRLTDNGLSLWDILKIIKNGIKTSFVGYEEKKKLMLIAEKMIEEWINNVLLKDEES